MVYNYFTVFVLYGPQNDVRERAVVSLLPPRKNFYFKLISAYTELATDTCTSLGGLWIVQLINSLSLKALALIYKVKTVFYHPTHF